MDQLFDSVNGSSVNYANGKTLRCAVSKKSRHHVFWETANKILSSFNFLIKENSVSSPPSAKNWINTIQSLKYIWGTLEKDFKFLVPRHFNQDALENFFGCIRSHGYRNINPHENFINSFKSLLVSNFLCVKPPTGNCENDECEEFLFSLKCFLDVSTNKLDHCTIIIEDVAIPPTSENVCDTATKTYVAGFVAKIILKKVGTCEHCKKNLIGSEKLKIHEIVEARDYGPNTLCYATTYFSKKYIEMIDIISTILSAICHNVNIKQNIMNFVRNKIKLDFTCPIHNLSLYMLDAVTTFYIIIWCREINKILKGLYYTQNVNYIDKMKKMAVTLYEKRKSSL